MASMALAFDILARDKASATLNKIGNTADKTGGRLSKFGGVAKTALAGGAAAGVAAFGAALFQGGKDAVAFETLALKSEAVIKSTGNAASISVSGIQKLAGSLESLSGVDEELIINSQNVLATFTQIRNTDTRKTFDEATEAALNMSVALGQDLQSATTMVGKALNDPVKGLTALGKAGIQFTGQQKEQIKAMVEAGDVAGAQSVILGELETQFGGAAEAAGSGLAGDMARLKDVMGDTFRQIATALLPILTDLAEWLAENLPAAIENFKRGLAIVSDFASTYVWPVLKFGAEVLRGIASVIADPVIPMIGRLIEWFTKIASKIAEVAMAVGSRVGEIVSFIVGIPGRIASSVSTMWNGIRDSFTSTRNWISGRVGDIVGFVSGMGSRIRGAASGMWDGITAAFRSAMNMIIRGWNRLEFRIPGFKIGPVGYDGFTLGVPDIPTLHKGGTVMPWGIEPLRSDEIMAKLQVGETVIPRGVMPGGDRRIVEAHFHGVDGDTSRMALDRLSWELAN